MLLLTTTGAPSGSARRFGVGFLDVRPLGQDLRAMRAMLQAGSGLHTCLLAVDPQLPPGQLAFRLKRRAAERVFLLAAEDLAGAHELQAALEHATELEEVRPPPPRLETSRVILSHPSVAQIDDFYAAIIGSDMFDTLQWDGPRAPRELYDWWLLSAQQAAEGITRPLSLALLERDSLRYVGGMTLSPLAGDPAQLDLGYALAPHARGRGLATEAVGRLVDEAFAVREAERIIAVIFKGNHASRRLAERLGFRCEATLRRAVCKRGAWLDAWLFAITRPDWQARQAS